MKPPICAVCHRTAERDWLFRHGDWVQFADYQPVPDQLVGHPAGFEWFCGRHLRAAQNVSGLSLLEALARIH